MRIKGMCTSEFRMFKATNSHAASKRVQEGSNHWDRGAVSMVQHTDKAVARLFCVSCEVTRAHAREYLRNGQSPRQTFYAISIAVCVPVFVAVTLLTDRLLKSLCLDYAAGDRHSLTTLETQSLDVLVLFIYGSDNWIQVLHNIR